MANLEKIKTIVLVMMENRSFDHMLGYRSLPPLNIPLDGQRENAAWKNAVANVDTINGRAQEPFPNLNPYSLPSGFDPPHQRTDVAMHLGDFVNGVYAMNGFIKAIPAKVSSNPNDRRLVMSYFGAAEAPITEFFGNNFSICDRWFAALPSGTQPNRLMAMSGISMIDSNQTPLPSQELIYDWLDKNRISWCVYHQGVPFFTMMLKWVGRILLSDNFRPFSRFESDMANTPPAKRPKVIFIEPDYGDCPHFGRSTDDHAPSGISDGQEFLMQVYNAVTASPSFWKNSLTVISYDEHGGFFDHVSPPLIRTDPPPGVNYLPFTSLGVRVPGYLISPFVKQGVVHNLFDHTSVLKLIGERFGPKGKYSSAVDNRPVESISAALDFTNLMLNAPPAPPMDAYIHAVAPADRTRVEVPPMDTELKKAFRDGIDEMKRQGAGTQHPKFGSLIAQVP
jgi:phospholipase C